MRNIIDTFSGPLDLERALAFAQTHVLPILDALDAAPGGGGRKISLAVTILLMRRDIARSGLSESDAVRQALAIYSAAAELGNDNFRPTPGK